MQEKIIGSFIFLSQRTHLF